MTYKDRSRKPRKDRTTAERPNFFETTSPFETTDRGGSATDVSKGLQQPVAVHSRDAADRPLASAFGALRGAAYDNPRGYPGLAMVSQGGERSKFPLGRRNLSINQPVETELTRKGR
jgi:hypothetical protein